MFDDWTRQGAWAQEKDPEQALPGQGRPPQEALDRFLDHGVSVALVATASKNRDLLMRVTTGLAQRSDPQFRLWFEQALAGRLRSTVSELWSLGWQPGDLARSMRRRLGDAHVLFVRDAIADELSGYARVTIDPRWQAQLRELGATVWWPPERTYLTRPGSEWAQTVANAFETLAQLRQLPPVEVLGPLPGHAPPQTSAPVGANGAGGEPAPVDEKVLDRVRQLLAKAESTTFPAEAETFTAGAQAMMARHSIDVALLSRRGGPGRDSGTPAARRIWVDNPYEGPKVMLLAAVARANRCRTVWHRSLGFTTVVGFASDQDAVEMLFTSLLVQATAAMTQSGSHSDVRGRSRTRSFRQSFLTAYAERIGQRLEGAAASEADKVMALSPDSDLLPVLAARSKQVDDAVEALFPKLRPMRASVTNGEGWASGWDAADRARLSAAREISA
jgi:hypothetical protein